MPRVTRLLVLVDVDALEHVRDVGLVHRLFEVDVRREKLQKRHASVAAPPRELVDFGHLGARGLGGELRLRPPAHPTHLEPVRGHELVEANEPVAVDVHQLEVLVEPRPVFFEVEVVGEIQRDAPFEVGALVHLAQVLVDSFQHCQA